MTRLLDTTGPLDLAPLEADTVRDGTPRAGSRALTTIGETEVGVWEMTTGTATDVETDEVFVVLSGSGEVTFADGETIALSPGVTVRLQAGEHTVWRVEETLRKVYLA